MKKTKIAFIFGTRPEIIKLSPIIRLCAQRGIEHFTVHTGQHYSHSMYKLFLNELGLRRPDYNLMIRSKAPHKQGDHTGRMMVKIENILLKEMPTVVLVQGDTNTALAGALTASKISTTRSFTGFDIKVGHVESGLRSYDRGMPEEINRVIVDHLSNYLFAPTREARNTAIAEGISKKKVWVTGNTIVDAIYHARRLSETVKGDVLSRAGLKKNAYILLTLHRQENVDNRKVLIKTLAGVEKVSRRHKIPVVFPIHPRTVKMFKAFRIKPCESIKIIEPLGFVEFLALESEARLILSDSGGVQEEACVLRVPCVTLRSTTERPETVDVGANIIAGHDPAAIQKACDAMLSSGRKWKNPLGDGRAAEHILKILKL